LNREIRREDSMGMVDRLLMVKSAIWRPNLSRFEPCRSSTDGGDGLETCLRGYTGAVLGIHTFTPHRKPIF